LRIGCHLERQGLLECDAENSYLAGDALESGPMEQLLGSSMMCMDAPCCGLTARQAPSDEPITWHALSNFESG